MAIELEYVYQAALIVEHKVSPHQVQLNCVYPAKFGLPRLAGIAINKANII